MASAAQISSTLSAREFAEGLLAGLAVSHQKEISANQLRLHKAFLQVLKEVESTRALDVDFSDVDYDPLYGLSGWLDEFLARAQRDLLISSPNPSYGRIVIKVTPAEGAEILAHYSDGAAIKRFSERFVDYLSA